MDEALARIEAAAFSQPWTREQIASELQRPEGLLLLTTDSAGDCRVEVPTPAPGKRVPVGYCLCRNFDGPAWELPRIAVEPQGRGRGLGRGLLDRAIREMRARGAERVLLEVSVNNTAALALYRGAGFQEIDRRRKYYADGSDALIMEAILNRADETRTE